MLNLLRSDFYRATRARGLRGIFWQYTVVIAVVVLLDLGIAAFCLADPFGFGTVNIATDGLGLSFNVTAEGQGVSPTQSINLMQWLAAALAGNSSIITLASSFGIIEFTFSDLTSGYVKNIVSSLRGRAVYLGEKVLLAAVWSAVMLVLSIVIFVLATIALLTIPFGICFDLGVSVGSALLWIACTWAISVVFAVVPLFLAMGARIKWLTYTFAFLLQASAMPQLLSGIAHSSGGVLHVFEPLAPALETLANWQPATVLAALGVGAGNLFDPTGLYGVPDALPQYAWMLLCALIWLAAGSGLFWAVGRKKDL